MKSKPLLIAHRGYSAAYPENTLAAFEAAIKAGCDMIELDVHLARDGEPVVYHDFELGRASNGKGLISDFTADELQKLDAGSWFDVNFKKERIPLLSEVFGLVFGGEGEPRCQLNIEIKSETLVNDSAYDKMATRVLELIRESNSLDSVVISSFNWRVLNLLRSMDSQVKLGLLNNEIEKGTRLDQAQAIRPFSYHPNFRGLNKFIVNGLREAGLKVYPYTANEIADYEMLCDFGVDGIITNEVTRLKEFLRNK